MVLQAEHTNNSQTLSQLRIAISTLPTQITNLNAEVANALLIANTANTTAFENAAQAVAKRDEMQASVTTAQVTKFNSTKALEAAKNAQSAAVSYMVSHFYYYQIMYLIERHIGLLTKLTHNGVEHINKRCAKS